MKDLEEAIKEIIEQTYDCKYTGMLKVYETFQDDPKYKNPIHLGYKVEIGLNKDERPVELAMDGNKKQFLNFIKKEIKNNRYNFVDFFKADRLYFSVGCCEE